MDDKEEKQKIQKIKSIIEREIEKELISKQNEVSDISEKIKNILRNLELLKYVVAVSYYDQNPLLTSKKGQEEESEDEKSQHQIHPCIKKLLPFQSNYNKSFGDVFASHSYETRNSKKTCSSESVAVNIKSEINDSTTSQADRSGTLKLPQYIPPLPNADETVQTVNSARGSGSKNFYRVVIGNVSKWIPLDTREDTSTHKWMMYIRNKNEEKDITKLLKKVRYFLHESYKPHDIIDVSHPFQLTRRGWGEFPIRVQLHFINPLNKPVDIIHNLKLDMTCSGVQMLGAETVVEVCLHDDDSSCLPKDNNKTETNTTLGLVKEELVQEKQDVYDDSLLMNVNGFQSTDSITGSAESSQDVVIKQEPIDNLECQNFFYPKLEEIKLAINNSRKFLLDRRKAMKTIEIEHDYLKTNNSCEQEGSINDFSKSVVKMEGDNNDTVGKILKNGVILDTVQIDQVLNKKNKDNFNKMTICTSDSEEEIFKTLKTVFNMLEAESQTKQCTKVFRHMYLVNILQKAHATKFNTVEQLVKWFVKKWPVITKLSLDPNYKIIHPYSCPSEEEFFKYSIGKQRSAEWFRAKAIQKVLKSLKSVIPIEEEIWSTKQILLWSRFHGYFPLSYQKSIKIEPTDTSEVKSKVMKWNESSSDSDDCLDHNLKLSKSSSSKYFNGLNIGERKKNYKKSRKKEYGEDDRIVNYEDYNTATKENDPYRFGANEYRVLEQAQESDVEVVEIESVEKSPAKKTEIAVKVSTIPDHQLPFNKFVCDIAREIGIKIADEEIVPGVVCDSVSRVFSQSVASFLEELIRRSLAQAWMRNSERCPESLELNDVLAAIIEHPRFDIFTSRGLGEEMPSNSDI